MSTLVEALDRKWYPEYGAKWDNVLFRTRIMKVISPSSRVLDLGAGAGILPQMNFRGLASRVYGIDPDRRVAANPNLDHATIGSAESLPYADESFDVVICNSVVEHLSDPMTVFAEVQRVLKPGGVFMFKTPNKWHYMPVLARILPHRVHELVNQVRGRAVVDTFPTLYRANAAGPITSVASSAGLIVTSLAFFEGRPEYLRFCALTYSLGWLYERVVNSTSYLRKARVVIIGTLQKPAIGPTGK
ncbi:MAG: class I SAM-dependent methyltransferase [Bryobacteraceae bacterium]|jgi:SAM-dependent methyltransferase